MHAPYFMLISISDSWGRKVNPFT